MTGPSSAGDPGPREAGVSSYPPRKYVGLQHTVYKAGWKDALHEVGDAIDRVKQANTPAPDGPPRMAEEWPDVVEQIEAELGKLVPR